MKKTFLIFFIFIGQLFALDLNFNTFSSDFIQIVKSKNSTLSYSGHFILSKDQAYWSYDTPSKKEIYINNNPFYIEIRLKNISRKRFIKLLMGKCMNKRLAEQFADFIFNRYGYYNQLFILSF